MLLIARRGAQCTFSGHLPLAVGANTMGAHIELHIWLEPSRPTDFIMGCWWKCCAAMGDWIGAIE